MAQDIGSLMDAEAPASPVDSVLTLRLNQLTRRGYRIKPERGRDGELRLKHPARRWPIYVTDEGAVFGSDEEGATCGILAEEAGAFEAFMERIPRANPVQSFAFAHSPLAPWIGFFALCLLLFALGGDLLARLAG